MALVADAFHMLSDVVALVKYIRIYKFRKNALFRFYRVKLYFSDCCFYQYGDKPEKMGKKYVRIRSVRFGIFCNKK